jgi:DNA-binding NtrC family response regulator
MRIWCHGNQEFVSAVRKVVHASAFDAALADEGATVAVDLDEQHGLQQVKKLAAQGYVVVGLCHPSQAKRLAQAVRFGAERVAVKPPRAEDLLDGAGDATVQDAVETWRSRYGADIIGQSDALRSALEIASRAAEFDCPVLITGESGTGKELLARAIHLASDRAPAPMVPVNCPAIPSELVESELFGHSKGAFTGATAARVGRFAAADKGTLFLDEIGEMDLNIQSKLLRVLQDYQITPVGESRCQRVDVRIVAATNRDLEKEAEEGRFREDLLYRLNVLQIHLPALRERREDIQHLLTHFLESLSTQRNVTPPQLDEEVTELLLSYDWPGNIRQLRNIVERLVILRHGQKVRKSDLPPTLKKAKTAKPSAASQLGSEMALPKSGIDLRQELQRIEDQLIRQALSATSGNKNQAARMLGLKRTTLVEKLRKNPVAFEAELAVA